MKVNWLTKSAIKNCKVCIYDLLLVQHPVRVRYIPCHVITNPNISSYLLLFYHREQPPEVFCKKRCS